VCLVPGAPLNFRNVSRSVSSVSFSWNSPDEVNGILSNYKVTCSVLLVVQVAKFMVENVALQQSYQIWQIRIWAKDGFYPTANFSRWPKISTLLIFKL